ncbi:MAG: DUF1232 domain-containing protein [Dehalococcoidia bacterium]|jgi:uncharacterized membrane protein YkvA (DUF1232 family)|nr:hypothetical protein [Chloroflexota bacterium]MDP7261277.1 DUF1232 domain-containing protein [Dehalococcoidia bacterium]MDP7485403.1 DUF1232 domain-containing protein [Dehalococcoidia bacterium]|tara:strand:- start:2834 stop:3244 length:411 start_codon:yes stop_codon:yes gene_type:complete
MFRLLPIRSLVIPFLKLVWRLLLDKRIPAFTKVIPFTAVIYIVSPYDLIGDRIPVLGQFDDLIVTTILFLLFIAASPGHVVADQTIGRKLRDLQNQQGSGEPADDNNDTGKTVDAEFRYVDNATDETDDESNKKNK